MRRRDALTGLIAVGFSAPAIAQGSRKLTMVTDWPEDMPGLLSTAGHFARTVGEASKGRIAIEVFPANAMVRAFETFDAVSAGVADKRMFCAQGGAPLDTLPDGKTFRAKFKSAFGADVDTYAPAFYAATLVVADAMQKAGSAKPEVFVKTLRVQSFASILGPVKFDANGDWVDAPVTVYRLNGGALTAIAQKD